jgi:hypothetical protein
MVDKPWEEGAIKVIRKAQVPCSHLFPRKKQVLFIIKISGTLRTAKLLSEVFSQNTV